MLRKGSKPFRTTAREVYILSHSHHPVLVKVSAALKEINHFFKSRNTSKRKEREVSAKTRVDADHRSFTDLVSPPERDGVAWRP